LKRVTPRTSSILQDTLTLILAGGQGERLYPLTKHRAKPAVPFGGIYRIIDFALSNCINSQLKRICILTQYKSDSLDRHIRLGWNIFPYERGEFIFTMPPQFRASEKWYQGTADAVYQNIYTIERERPEYVVILCGDHIYKMDYSELLEFHVASGADATVSTIEFPRTEASHLGVLEIDRNQRIVGFEEKPSDPKPMPNNPNLVLASMGIYVFNTPVLIQALLEDAEQDTSHDFGRNVIPNLIGDKQVYAFNFKDMNQKEAKYWRDVGTLDAYFEANMDLISVDPQFNLYDKEWPIRTHVRSYPPAKTIWAMEHEGRVGVALNSIISQGSIVSGGRVTNSILSPEVRVNSYSSVDECILMNGVDVGRHARLHRVIVDKHVHIPAGTRIGYDLEEDRRRYSVTESGVVVIPRNACFCD
jgi:glucose-1-phosphate adenylyltransferase